VRFSLRAKYRYGTERVERERTSVVGGVSADVVREAKYHGSACTRGDRPLGICAQQRTRGKRATAGRRVIDRCPVKRDLGQVSISSLRPGDGQPRKQLRHAGAVKDADADILPAERLSACVVRPGPWTHMHQS